MPLVSIVIPTYNRGHVLERAILSVLRQTYKDFELIVVDDGSFDSTSRLLSEYEGKIKVLFQKNRGVSAARNLGIRHSRGDLIAFLDSDDEWLPDKLAKQAALFDPGKRFFVSHTDEIWIRAGKELHQKKIHRKQGGQFFVRALERCLISPSSVMISLCLLDTVGWFDEALPAAEDYDLWLRLTAFHEVDFVPEPLIIKHGGAKDQLSTIIPAIDRHRIAAIVKILSVPGLRPDYRDAAILELNRKCAIVATGLAKRGRHEEADTYDELARSYQVDTLRSE